MAPPPALRAAPLLVCRFRLRPTYRAHCRLHYQLHPWVQAQYVFPPVPHDVPVEMPGVREGDNGQAGLDIIAARYSLYMVQVVVGGLSDL